MARRPPRLGPLPARDQRPGRRHEVRRKPSSGARRHARRVGRIDGFLAGLGLRAKPELVRLRPARPGPSRAVTELAVRADELAELAIAPRTARRRRERDHLPERRRAERRESLSGARASRSTGSGGSRGSPSRSHLLGRHRHAWLRHPRPAARVAAADPLGPDGSRDVVAHRDRWVAEERPPTSVAHAAGARERSSTPTW